MISILSSVFMMALGASSFKVTIEMWGGYEHRPGRLYASQARVQEMKAVRRRMAASVLLETNEKGIRIEPDIVCVIISTETVYVE
jgi:hypothetical protein